MQYLNRLTCLPDRQAQNADRIISLWDEDMKLEVAPWWFLPLDF